MKNRITIITTLLLLLSAGSLTIVRGQSTTPVVASDPILHSTNSPDTIHQIDAAIYFRVGESHIDPDFKDNKHRLAAFISTLEDILSNPEYVISRMVVVGTASPDGSRRINEELAGRRAEVLANYLTEHSSLPSEKIEIINGGENWEGLRLMIEASKDIPHKSDMLRLIATPDRNERKQLMMNFANGESWIWMYNHFFAQLRIGAGDTHGRASLNALSRKNREQMQKIVGNLDIDAQARQALIDVISDESDPQQRILRFKALCSDPLVYQHIQNAIVSELLSEPSPLSTDNWTLLREEVAASDMPLRDSILHIIDNTPISHGREQQLQALNDGHSYNLLLDLFLPELLITSQTTRPEVEPEDTAKVVPLRDENWRRLREMISASEMPDRDNVLALIDEQADPITREQQLRELNNGETYRYINEVFFPELLYGISSSAQENWVQLSNAVNQSDLALKSEIQHIIRTTSPGVEREQAIRALDNGESWIQMSEILLPNLLSNTEKVSLTGSGMSLSYELSPAAKQRAAMLTQKQTAEQPTQQEEIIKQEGASATHENTNIHKTTNATVQLFSPFLALKTDLMLWGGVMPNFKIGSWTPNLSAEFYFAQRWSAQAGWAYSNWNAISGSKELYAVSVGDLEVRHWFGKPSLFKGFYVGVYGNYGQYDIQENAVGQTGSFWCVGVGAGWMQQITQHWAIEAELRGGYRSANNELYDIESGHNYFNRRETVGKFSPQLRLQVVYRFGKTQK